MPIYDQPVRVLIRDMILELAPAKGALFSREDAVEWFRKHYPDVKEGTVSAHLVRFSTKVPSRLHHTVRPEEDLLFLVDRGCFRLYDPAFDPTPIHPNGGGGPPETDPEGDDELRNGEGAAFAYVQRPAGADGRPVAMIPATGKKEDSEASEARALLADPHVRLENALLTADPLHNKEPTLRVIVEKGGDYLVGTKGNTSVRLEAVDKALEGAPFLT